MKKHGGLVTDSCIPLDGLDNKSSAFHSIDVGRELQATWGLEMAGSITDPLSPMPPFEDLSMGNRNGKPSSRSLE